MDDVLRDTPVYQEMTRWAREEGLQQGLQRGRSEGRLEGSLEALQQALLAVIRESFPKLARLAKKQVAGIKEPEALQLLLVKINIARSVEEAQNYLLEVDEQE